VLWPVSPVVDVSMSQMQWHNHLDVKLNNVSARKVQNLTFRYYDIHTVTSVQYIPQINLFSKLVQELQILIWNLKTFSYPCTIITILKK